MEQYAKLHDVEMSLRGILRGFKADLPFALLAPKS